jgi:hypothetical protein
MGKKIELNEKYIIDEYLKGKSSLKLSEELKVSKPVILRILKEKNVTKKRDRCKSLNIKKDGDMYFVVRKCPNCNKDIKTKSKDKTICCRNYFNRLNGSGLCKPCSLKLQMGEGNPFYGKKHSVMSKKQISKNRKGKGVGDKNSMANPKWKKKATKNLKKKWDNGEMEHARKIMSKKMKETIRKGKIKSYIKSKKEKEIFDEIKTLGYTIKQSYRVDTKICDLFVPKLNLIIEYFGDYWHCNPKKYDNSYFNKKKNQTAKEIWEYDKNKLELIRNYGYNLEVVWENDLKNNNKIILNIINKYETKNNFPPEWSRKD